MEKIKILLIDDHQIVRDGIKTMLQEEEDIDLIGTSSDGNEALEFLKHNTPDVIITDISMQQMSGLEFTAKANLLYSEIKVLVLSMYSNEDYVYNAIKAGAKGYLPKQDTTKAILLEAIRAIQNGEEYYSPSISRVVMKSYINNVKGASLNDSSKKQSLTTREKEILKLYVEGNTNQEIADKLSISIRTVETHKNNIMQKYNFKSTVDMVKYAIRNNIVEL